VKDFNIYLRLLIDELKNLWQYGAMVRDVSIVDEERRHYMVRVILMWTQHDYPGYGIASSLQSQGMYACPPCGPEEVPSYSKNFLGKVTYHGHRKFLKKKHRWRARWHNDKFNGKDEESTKPPMRWIGWDWLCQWEKVEARTVQLNSSGMKDLSIFYELEYWAVHFQSFKTVL
jgi:hypothetical protein